MTVKKVGFEKKSSLQVIRNAQLLLTGAFCRLLATHFSSANNISAPQLKQFVYNDDHTKTNILIQPHYKWLTAITQMRPALIVKRGDMSTSKIAIADGFGETIEQGMAKNKFISGTHTIFCVSEQGGSVELLGEEVFQMLLEFSPAIREDFNLLRIEVSGIGAVSKIEEFDEHFAVPITITWTRQNVWSLKYDGPWLQDVSGDTTLFNKGRI